MGTKKILFAIFILALALRLFIVFTQKESERVPRSDASNYDMIAMNLASGYGFSEEVENKKVSTARRTPVYPLFLSIVYRIFGHSYLAVKTVQAIIGALFCIVIFFIGSAIYDDRVGVIASFMTAIYKPFVSGFFYYGGPAYLLSEYLYMFFVGLSVLMTFYFIKKENNIFKLLGGLIIGLAILTRPEFILYPILLIFYLLHISKFSVKRMVKSYFLVYFFILLTMSPWVIRNYAVHGKFIPLSTFGGYIFLLGNNSTANGGWSYPEDHKTLMSETKNFSEYEKNRIFFEKGMKYLISNPTRIPGLFMRKILVHWAPFEEGFNLFNPYYAVVFLFAVIGVLVFKERSIMKDILIITFFITTLAAIITVGDPRYRYPYESFLIVFCAATLNGIFDITKRRSLKNGR